MDVGDLPMVNACLNGSAAAALCAGYVAIRRGRVELHRALMVLALVLSALFLSGYVTYHWHHGSTRFGGEGWIRPVYFTILLTHTVLAVAVVPLVGMTLWRALADRREEHRAMARWTLPIWFYVSVTGVVIYLILYRMGYPILSGAAS